MQRKTNMALEFLQNVLAEKNENKAGNEKTF